MFSKYYQEELSYLRDVGRTFGLANPAIAGLLTERGADPDVERLLEGVAFLTARIRERTEDSLPEVLQGLSQLLLPNFLRPLPGCAVVEFLPQVRALKKPLTVARGTHIAATPVDGTSCVFRTTADLTLLPLQLTETTFEGLGTSAPLLRVGLSSVEQSLEETLRTPLRFYLHGEHPLASTLMLWVARYCRGVQVRVPGSAVPVVRLPASAIRSLGHQVDEALLPTHPFAPAGPRLVQEYFTLPQKFLFFEVVGLEVAAGRIPATFELAFEFERPPPLPTRPGRDILKLHTVPAVNLFECDADPIRLEHPHAEHLVRAAGLNPGHMEVHSIDDVVGLRLGDSERRTYPPFIAFEHAAEARAHFSLRHAPSPIDEGWDAFLSLSTSRDVPLPSARETLSLRLTCSNRNLPRQLRPGDLRHATSTSPTLARFLNVTPVTAPVRPPLGADLHWRLLSHLGINQRSLTEPGVLSALLGLYDFQKYGDVQTSRANQLRVEAVKVLQTYPARRLLAGSPVRGQRTVLELNEGGFTSLGDAFLFASAIDVLFAERLTLNAFHELGAQLSPSKTEFAWTPRSGTQSLV